MKIAITGATSFIGWRLMNKALSHGWDVAAIVRRNSPKTKQFRELTKVEVFEANMDEYSNLGMLIGEVDCFAHLAWNGTRGKDRMNARMQAENYIFSIDAITSMINCGCKRILTAGSQAEYGVHNCLVTEETPCAPNTEYGIKKLETFLTVSQLCELKGVSYKEPRYFSLYGPGDYKDTLVMSMILKLLKREKCEVTQCIQMWDYCYVDDAIEATFALCEKECVDGAYNIGGGDIRELREYVEEIRNIIGGGEVSYGAVQYPPTGIVSILPSIKKITEQTGWMPKTDFNTGIKKIIASINDINYNMLEINDIEPL